MSDDNFQSRQINRSQILFNYITLSITYNIMFKKYLKLGGSDVMHMHATRVM